MRVYELLAGRFHPIGARLFHGRFSSRPSWGRGELVCRSLLIESPRGLVLIDTGLDWADLRKQPWPIRTVTHRLMSPQTNSYASLTQQMHRMGFDPREVRHVVMTHLDVDHAGGLKDFPWAKIHVSQREYDLAMQRPDWLTRIRYQPAHWAHDVQWVIHPSGHGRWFDFTGTVELPGFDGQLRMVPLPGHTLGHVGVAIQTEQGWLLHAGDAILHHTELADPHRCPWFARTLGRVVCQDRQAWRDTLGRLRSLTINEQVRITNTHDADLCLSEALSKA